MSNLGWAEDDKALAALCTKNNDKAREVLYNKYAARVYMLCLRYIGDSFYAKDLMHDCFIKIFDNIHKYDSTKASLKTWISHVTINHLIDYLRKNKKITFISIDENILDLPEPNYKSDIQIPKEEILKMVTQLPDTKRLIFNLYCIEGHSHKEIAELLGIKEKTSSSLLYKARVELMAMVNAYLFKKDLKN